MSTTMTRTPRARLARLLPALALLLGALSLFTATPAQAQTTVWSATLTVDRATIYFGCDNNDATQDNCSSASVLTDDDFTYGGKTYAVEHLYWNSSSNIMELYLIEDGADVSASDLEAALGSLTLNVDGTAFAVSDHTSSTSDLVLKWPYDPATDWTDNQQVSVSLKIPLRSSLSPCTIGSTLPPLRTPSLTGLTVSTSATASALQFHAGVPDTAGGAYAGSEVTFGDGQGQRRTGLFVYVPFRQTSVWVTPTWTAAGAVATVESGASAPKCATSGTAIEVPLPAYTGRGNRHAVTVRLGGRPGGLYDSARSFTVIRGGTFDVSLTADRTTVTEEPGYLGQMVKITATLDRQLHVLNVRIPLTVTNGTAEAGDWGWVHCDRPDTVVHGPVSSNGIPYLPLIGLGQSTSSGVCLRPVADAETDNETLTVSIDMAALQASGTYALGPQNFPLPASTLFAAGTPTSVTITIDDNNTSVQAGLRGLGLQE